MTLPSQSPPRSMRLGLGSRAGVGALLLIACTLVAAAACRDEVDGSGQSATEQRSVAPFTELSVRGAIEAQVRIGQPQSVAITGDDNVVPIIKTDVSSNRLTVEPERSYNSSVPLRVEIVVPELDWIGISGASTVTVTGVDVDEMNLRASGASTLRVSGIAGDVKAEASGASRMRLEDLAAETADVDATGASTIEVTVSDRLTGSASGASTITYAGNPEVSVRASGASSVRQR
ncbi:MAG: head GIN domain-containing protein [Dehalococcoidia bacterium]